MRRTQIYLTDEQAERIAALASDRGKTKAEVIRGILDESLGTAAGGQEAEDRLVLAATSGLCRDYPDWPDWLAGVRGSGADRRLSDLGL